MTATGYSRLIAILAASGWLLASAWCRLPAHAQTAETAAPLSADIGHWIEQLGDDNYTVRQSAMERLMASGFAARAALAKEVDGPDPEIRAAARRLVALMDQNEFSRALAEFAADIGGRRGITLPGWKEFGTLVGHDEAARALFVTMQREEAPLLAQVFDNPAAEHQFSWDDQLARLMNWRNVNQQGGFTAPLGSCATLFFLGALPDSSIPDPMAGQLVQLALLPPVGEAIVAKRPDNAIRRLVSAWVVHCPSRNEQVLQMRLALMTQYELSEALPLAIAIARREDKYLTALPRQRVEAILAVGKLGSADDVSALEPLLEDNTEYLAKPLANGPRNFEHAVQIRDVALATMLRLTEQTPVAYGYLHERPHPQLLFDPTSLGMESDAQREAAAEKWRAWRLSQPRKPAATR